MSDLSMHAASANRIENYTMRFECEVHYSPQTRLDNFASSAAASFAFLPANSLLSTASILHCHKERENGLHLKLFSNENKGRSNLLAVSIPNL